MVAVIQMTWPWCPTYAEKKRISKLHAPSRVPIQTTNKDFMFHEYQFWTPIIWGVQALPWSYILIWLSACRYYDTWHNISQTKIKTQSSVHIAGDFPYIFHPQSTWSCHINELLSRGGELWGKCLCHFASYNRRVTTLIIIACRYSVVLFVFD